VPYLSAPADRLAKWRPVLDALPRPRVDRWFDVKRYERHGATVPIQTKRGCVYKCVYCTYRNVEG